MSIWEFPLNDNKGIKRYIDDVIFGLTGALGLLKEEEYTWFRAGVFLAYYNENALLDIRNTKNVTFEKVIDGMQNTILFKDTKEQRKILADLLALKDVDNLLEKIQRSIPMIDTKYIAEEEMGIVHIDGNPFLQKDMEIKKNDHAALRAFEAICGFEDVKLPQRSTVGSAGYDFFAPEDITIPSSINEDGSISEPFLLKTGVKAKFPSNEVLLLFNRSSNPKRKSLVIPNSVGVVDSDYYNNPDNEGEIGFLFWNLSREDIEIHKGEKIGQGIFQKFLTVDNDLVTQERLGGFGSTG